MVASSAVRRSQSCFAAVESSTKLPLLCSNTGEQAAAQRPCSVSAGVASSRKQRGGSSSLPPPGGKAVRNSVPDKLPAIGRGAVGEDTLPSIVAGSQGLMASGQAQASKAKRPSMANSGTPRGHGRTSDGSKPGRGSAYPPRPDSGGRPPPAPKAALSPGVASESTKRKGSEQSVHVNRQLASGSVTAHGTPQEQFVDMPGANKKNSKSKPGGNTDSQSPQPPKQQGRRTTGAVSGVQPARCAHTPAVQEESIKEVAEKGAAKQDGLKDFVSKELRQVMEEEAVTYSWRRGGAGKDASQKQSSTRPPAGEAMDVDTSVPQAETPMQHPTSTERKETPPKQLSSRQKEAPMGTKQPRGVKFAYCEEKAKASEQDVSGKGAGVQELVAVGSSSGSSRRTNATRDATAALDLEKARSSLPEKLDSGSVHPLVKLVAYDGQKPLIGPGPLSKAGSTLSDADCSKASPPPWLVHWLCGSCSGELASLWADHWVQGEVTWQEASDDKNVSAVAGMLANVSLKRVPVSGLFRDVLQHSPAQAASAAVTAALQAAGKELNGDEQEMLVSEAEVALSQLESQALHKAVGQQSTARLVAAVQREVLRFLWCPDLEALGDAAPLFDDAWILKELQRSPQEVEETFRCLSTEELGRQNRFLDSYLVRLLRLKRGLVALLDEWEKVDHYAIIGVPATASDKELKIAYRKACLRLHPDKGGDKIQFQQLQDAYARILEERAKAVKTEPSQQSAAPKSSEARRQPADKEGDGDILALETDQQFNSECPAADCQAAAEVLEVVERFRTAADEASRAVQEAERADGVLRELRKPQASSSGVEALSAAQKAGETLLQLSQQVAELAPQLGEAAMEVAECSLSLAAKFSSVPSALLLTDVALSCTFEASRLQHTGEQLLEVKRDTVSTLQTLQTNLSMAKIIGTVDAETLKLSLGLVSKAATRIMASLRQVGSALADATQRGQQCAVHAKAVCRFSEGRSAAEADEEPAALPAPEGAEFVPPSEEAGDPAAAGPEQQASPKGDCSRPRSAQAPKGPLQQAVAAMQARLQNDRLLRQLNGELVELQRRARTILLKRSGSVVEEDETKAFALAAEVLSTATEAVLDSFLPDVGNFEASLSRHFGFIETCGNQLLAAPADLHAQLLRFVALLDSQAVLQALQLQVRPRLAARCADAQNSAPLLAALERHLEVLAAAVVSARLA
eukprot:TRINITY_DN91413_c0_g1_i1.p1 TRINITY_DN91413_c0_g1~~TRINITY_DN91413_c0_g1_i1.p1  ORF type:complete len:1201 (-),score=299.63 TRINITY_DN91413_c0_g1_i1:100-3702(-)